MKLYVVDVFTDQLFGGNPAGVVMLGKEDFPSNEYMQKVARELKHSETAFVQQISEREFNTKYFTSEGEIELCGHATIGTFYALMKEGIINSGENYINNTLAGTLNICTSEDNIWMDMASPEVRQVIDKAEDIQELYNVMGIKHFGQGLIDDKCSILLPKIVSTGIADIMLPVKNEEELNLINPNMSHLSHLSERYCVTGVHAFTINSRDGKIHARNFAPLFGIDEEAATGTSNGALTFYLYGYKVLKANDINIVVQGEKMDRPSKISTILEELDNSVKIKVGGFAKTVLVGEIEIS